MKTYETKFVVRFSGFRAIEELVQVQADDMAKAKVKFAQLARDNRQAWLSKRIKLATA